MRAISFAIAVIGGMAFWAGHLPSAMGQTNAPATVPQSGSPTNGAFSSNVNTAGAIAPDKSHPLDLNAASAAELSALPGIGSKQSEAIVQGRPYRSKYDLVSRNILSKNNYDRIEDLINVQKH